MLITQYMYNESFPKPMGFRSSRVFGLDFKAVNVESVISASEVTLDTGHISLLMLRFFLVNYQSVNNTHLYAMTYG